MLRLVATTGTGTVATTGVATTVATMGKDPMRLVTLWVEVTLWDEPWEAPPDD